MSLTRLEGPGGFVHVDLEEVVYVGPSHRDPFLVGSYPHDIRLLGLRGGVSALIGDTEQNRRVLLDARPVGLGLVEL